MFDIACGTKIASNITQTSQNSIYASTQCICLKDTVIQAVKICERTSEIQNKTYCNNSIFTLLINRYHEVTSTWETRLE